jgi:hypothetical protein
MFELIDINKLGDDIVIGDYIDKCSLCGKKFKPFRHIKKDEHGIDQVEVITHDAACRNLLLKRTKLRNQLMDVDFQIYEKRKKLNINNLVIKNNGEDL